MLSAQLIDHGMDPTTPAALIERATLPDQRTLIGTVQTLPSVAREHDVVAPALIVVGSVVNLHAELARAMGVAPVTAVEVALEALA
jgi:siroheme synthase